MSLLSHYPDGSDITILNASYHRREQNPDTGKWNSDYMVISYKDNMNGTKGHEIIYEPTYEFYKAKDEVNITHNMFYIDSTEDLVSICNEIQSNTNIIALDTEFIKQENYFPTLSIIQVSFFNGEIIKNCIIDVLA